MTYRSRPAPRRRHRARWQDELRTQRLLVGAFAAAIAIALGVFGISAWSAYFDGHLRQVMVVEGTTVSREALDLRQTIIGAELQATGLDLNSQLGGARDVVLQQQLSVISDQFQNLTSTATGSIEDGLFQATRADGFGLSVSDEEVDAEVAARQNLPERVQLSLISFRALPTMPRAEPSRRTRTSRGPRTRRTRRGPTSMPAATSRPSPPPSRTTPRRHRPMAWWAGYRPMTSSTAISSRWPTARRMGTWSGPRRPIPAGSSSGSRIGRLPDRSRPCSTCSTGLA